MAGAGLEAMRALCRPSRSASGAPGVLGWRGGGEGGGGVGPRPDDVSRLKSEMHLDADVDLAQVVLWPCSFVEHGNSVPGCADGAKEIEGHDVETLLVSVIHDAETV